MDRKNAKKHICLIYEFLSEQGGLEREIIAHANMLKEEGYNVSILTCHFDKKILKLLPFDGLKIEEISRIKTPFEWLNLAFCFIGIHKLKNYSPNAFISYSFPCNFLIRKKRAIKINYVNHLPHFLYLKGFELIEWANATQGMKRGLSVFLSWILGPWLRRIDKKIIKNNKLVFMNSKFTKKNLDKLYNIDSIVSYPPLDKRFSKLPEKRINEKFIFSSSRIIPDKKYEWLIESCSLMKNKLPLYLAGSVEEKYRQRLIAFARQKNVNLRFLGRLNTEEIKNYYGSAQVFAFPAPGEDFGLVPAESLACGTPVVAWGDGAGPTEQITDKVNGYLAKPYNLKDFASKIDLIMETKIKSKNREKMINSSEKFSYNSIKKDFIKEVNKILEKNSQFNKG